MENPDTPRTVTDEDGREWTVVAQRTEPVLYETYLIGRDGDTWAALLGDEDAMVAQTYASAAEADENAANAVRGEIMTLRAEAGLWGYGSGMPGM